jgi:hypothetical protein
VHKGGKRSDTCAQGSRRGGVVGPGAMGRQLQVALLAGGNAGVVPSGDGVGTRCGAPLGMASRMLAHLVRAEDYLKVSYAFYA